ncbi:hypothetical protein Pla111_34400 [Botrimarina hoheduenensis]|uniref:Carboxypeptidase regulatory-like domain-containing protein n=1 Tax=Botrimarina hoheduenensis TaxID=2528000 RepID=A0A5C5VQN1_9BACT|nr:hypothetical protein Pla111_34400 [Botrimarina hoheduenensis]
MASRICSTYGTTLAVIAFAMASVGCSRGPMMVPVDGSVTLDDKPLSFGIVMLHPVKGQVAQGPIEPDGTFSLSTHHIGDGAQIGHYRVSVLCYQAHDPQKQPASSDGMDGFLLGQSLVPLHYTRATSSGLTVDVNPDGVRDLRLDLRSRQ